MSSKLLPDRYPTGDLFIADIFDAAPKDDQASMEHPMFSLATQPDMTPRYYEHNGNSIEINPSRYGMPTIWDKDVLIFCISQLMAGINNGREPKQTVRVTAYDLLKSINKKTGGSQYQQLKTSLRRLRNTEIVTSIKTNDSRITEGFGLIDWWRVVEKSPDDAQMVAVDVKLSDWLYNAVLGAEVLSLNRDYFRLRGGLERRLYELARKHCGKQDKWTVGIELLYKKSGAKSQLKHFRAQLKRIAEDNILPDYRMRLDTDKDQVIFYLRKGSSIRRGEIHLWTNPAISWDRVEIQQELTLWPK